ncbi:hypothetical protein ABN228_22075, partial [Providencia rettgeri]|uniref:hypothetical protein n=1 Tax=Providencia rettgeri TaxID=587 RepID=UPI0032DB8F47
AAANANKLTVSANSLIGRYPFDDNEPKYGTYGVITFATESIVPNKHRGSCVIEHNSQQFNYAFSYFS